MDKKSEYEARLITLGDSLVGKSCLIIRYIEDKYFTNYLSTIGFDLKYKLVSLNNGEKLKLTIHDTAGEERFRALSKNYIKKADGILVVYDITNKNSFLNVENWIKCAKDELTLFHCLCRESLGTVLFAYSPNDFHPRLHSFGAGDDLWSMNVCVTFVYFADFVSFKKHFCVNCVSFKKHFVSLHPLRQTA